MIVCRTRVQMRAARHPLRAPVGFVPTMGALHSGHESLLERARAECASVVASIYVNPRQFGVGEDLAKYPRSFDDDAAMLERHGVDALFAPGDDEMYPSGSQTSVDPGPIAQHLEGEFRPGHFRGVATIVSKLFNVIAPDRAFFGRKDAQQLAVIRRMAADLDLSVEIVDCPTIRERDGLAVSSRNRLLSDTERRDAVGLSRALTFIVEALRGGASDLGAVLRGASLELGPLRAEYLALVDPAQFVPLTHVPAGADLLAVGAAYCGATRLIDNMQVHTT